VIAIRRCAGLRRYRAAKGLKQALRELPKQWFIYKPTERDTFHTFWLIRKIQRLSRVLQRTSRQRSLASRRNEKQKARRPTAYKGSIK